jgi:hypothetical protein
MIKNMSPDEARIMRLFSVQQSYPVVEVQAHGIEAETYQTVERRFSLVGREAGCDFPDHTPTYLDNLVRLGLLELPRAYGIRGPMLATPGVYESLESEAAQALSELKNHFEDQGGRLAFERSFITLTDLGLQFCRACVIEKGST